VVRGQKFSKERKILSPKEFKLVLDGGKRFRTPSFIVFVKPSAFKRGRLGISVSRQMGKAHERTRIKRILREAFRKRTDLPEANDWVFIFKAPAAQKKNKDVFQEVESLFNKLIQRKFTA
jgi:ribonuclease P protein component